VCSLGVGYTERMERALQIVGFNSRNDRQKDDYYATPTEATQALLAVETFEGPIWEPCCGEGHISKVLLENGYKVHSTDLVDRGYGVPRIDALMERRHSTSIITNPPYKNALEFAEHFTDYADKTALLLKLNFLEGVKRKEFFQRKPPVRVHVFSARQALMKNGHRYEGGGMMALAWFVWEKGSCELPTISWI